MPIFYAADSIAKCFNLLFHSKLQMEANKKTQKQGCKLPPTRGSAISAQNHTQNRPTG